MVRGQTAVPLVSIQFQMKTLEPAASFSSAASFPSVLSDLFWSQSAAALPNQIGAHLYVKYAWRARVRFTRMLSHYLSDFKVLARERRWRGGPYVTSTIFSFLPPSYCHVHIRTT